MNKKFLIATDMDGTLLNNKSQVSEGNKQYLLDLEKQGHIVVLASGRPLRALQYFYNQIGLHGPLICYNGAYCLHPNDNKFPQTIYNFPKEVIKQIYNDIGPENVGNVMCETNDEIWLHKHDENLNKFFWHQNMEIIYGDIRETLTKDPWTMIMELTDKSDQDKISEAVHKHDGFEVRFWYTMPYCEIYYKKTSKAKCIHEIAKYYDIPKSQIIALGDADNDIEMMTECGYTIAMSNGNQHIKDIATTISPKDNDHDGVKYALIEALKNLA